MAYSVCPVPTQAMQLPCAGIKSNQNIILMEMFVDFLEINAHVQKLLPRYREGRIFVTYRFMDFPPIVIKEDVVCKVIPAKCCATPSPVFDTGRSGMFSIPFMHCDDKAEFNIEVTMVYPGGCPDRTELGRAYLELAEDLSFVMLTAAFNPERIPVRRRIKEEHYLFDYSDTVIGVIGVDLKMTCMGNVTIDKFESCKPQLPQPAALCRLF